MGAHVQKEIKAEIMAKIEQGYQASVLAREYEVSAATIYQWIKAKDSKGLHLLPDTKLTPDEQIEHLTDEYTRRLKAILIKQIQDKIKDLNL